MFSKNDLLKAEADVLSGRACAKEQGRGDGPCGACARCLRAEIARLTAENERLRGVALMRCDRCCGTGVAPLSAQRQRVLDAVRERGEASPVDVVHALNGVDSSTKLNRAANVCAWLLRHGLLRVARRAGKHVVYVAVQEPLP